MTTGGLGQLAHSDGAGVPCGGVWERVARGTGGERHGDAAAEGRRGGDYVGTGRGASAMAAHLGELGKPTPFDLMAIYALYQAQE